MKSSVKYCQWPIRGHFTISRGRKTHAETLIVRLEMEGHSGQGECVPYARYGESIESVTAQINDFLNNHPLTWTHATLNTALAAGAARNALDCALWDLQCKIHHKSIWQTVAITPQPVVTAYTLSLDSVENMNASAIQQAHRPILKLKLGDADDLNRVATVRHAAPNSRIIIDANEAWTKENYIDLLPELVALNVAMIEQPFSVDNDHHLNELARPIPICADESCHDRKSLPMLVGKYDVINIKLDKTGGLTEALALKAEAERKGFTIMVGCMVSSSLSMAPAYVVAQGAAIADLDGPLLLNKDIEPSITYSNSEISVFSPRLWG